MDEFYKENPEQLEDWEDLKLWRDSSNNVFKKALTKHIESKLVKVDRQYLLDCLTNKKYSEISLVPESYNIEFTYKVCGLFVNMYEKFFILEKNDEFYAVDVSQEYNYI